MGKSTFSMVIFNSYVKLPEGTFDDNCLTCNLRSGKRLRYAVFFPDELTFSHEKPLVVGFRKRSSPPLQSLEFSHLSFQRDSSEFPLAEPAPLAPGVFLQGLIRSNSGALDHRQLHRLLAMESVKNIKNQPSNGNPKS